MGIYYFPVADPNATYQLPHWDGHNAVDIFAPAGTPCLAVEPMDCKPYDFPLGGYTVIGQGRETRRWYYYAHMHQLERATGYVPAGALVGRVSNSGNAYKGGKGEPHLHWTVTTALYGGPDEDGAGDLALGPLLKKYVRLSAPLVAAPPDPCADLRAQVASLETRLGVLQGEAEGCVYLALRRANNSLWSELVRHFGEDLVPIEIFEAVRAIEAATDTLKST